MPKVTALNDLFQQCFRIQREASFAAGHHIPMVIENVKGAQPWVGRARWNFGSFYLWGDVPALMPQTMRAINGDHAIKNAGGSWFNIGSSGQKVTGQNPVHALSGLKLKDQDGYERDHPDAFGWKKPRTSSGSRARKAASALIAKIPLPLSRHIGVTYHP